MNPDFGGKTQHEPLVRSKMPELDSLCGIAILLVVFYHGFFWSAGSENFSGLARAFMNVTRAGWMGVNLFFVLSGFLITGILLQTKPDAQYYKRFYSRRVLRIFPIYWALLIVLAFLPSQSRRYLLMSFFYLANVVQLFGVPNTYPMLWSLAVEEHFYMVWPLVVRWLSRVALLRCAAGVFVLSPVLRAVAYRNPLPAGFSGFTWLVADGLAAGALLAVYIRRPGCTRKRLGAVSGGAISLTAFMALFGAPYGILSRWTFVGATLKLTAAHAFFFGLLGLVLLCGTSRWKFLVNLRVLQFYGKISYGLYLLHWLCFHGFDLWLAPHVLRHSFFDHMFMYFLARFACAAGTATLVAFLSRWYFEEPFLRLKNRFS